ncbi:MAG: hypothetical protein KME04_02130 [Pleurocapsa minor GSE-CHR-MK-17-07R]|jgi:MarR-like DNA-binding transcriptional regulator SgrR of sgrS sRNA|nr:hypothetical protein [Pleurocapsa minor GSE-CHR-MK 17-07R]MBW4435902.1 hypothetical protein [Pleurocapsa minor GSE-CHR-MK 17-07R]
MQAQETTISPYRVQQYERLYAAAQAHGALTVAQAADCLGLKKSQYVRSLLDGMVAVQWMRCEFQIGRYHRFVYTPVLPA